MRSCGHRTASVCLSVNMLDQEAVARLTAALVSRAGGYLRNPVRQERVTCAVCTTPVAGYELCFQCNRHRAYDGLADAVAFLTYAVAGQQSGYVMRGYKAQRPVNEHVAIVVMLILRSCARDRPVSTAECPVAEAGRRRGADHRISGGGGQPSTCRAAPASRRSAQETPGRPPDADVRNRRR